MLIRRVCSFRSFSFMASLLSLHTVASRARPSPPRKNRTGAAQCAYIFANKLRIQIASLCFFTSGQQKKRTTEESHVRELSHNRLKQNCRRAHFKNMYGKSSHHLCARVVQLGFSVLRSGKYRRCTL